MRRKHTVYTFKASVPVPGKKQPRIIRTDVSETSEARAHQTGRETLARMADYHRDRLPVAWVTVEKSREACTVEAPKGTYPHGDRRKYILERCHCDLCRQANNAYEKQRHRLKAYGKAGNVDAGPARDHVARLMAKGMGYKRIAAAAGLNPKTVHVLVAGRSERNTPPPEQIRKTTADKLLAVPFSAVPRQLVDALPLWEMVANMMQRGWSQAWIAAQLGYSHGALQLDTIQVEAKNFAALLHLYRRTPGMRVATNRHEQAGITRSIRRGEVLSDWCEKQRANRKRSNRVVKTGIRTGQGSRGVAA